MADDEAGQLSPEQQAALEQYTAVTAQDVNEAIPLLQRCQWNVQIAISKFFDGEEPDPVGEALRDDDHIPALTGSRLENLQESLMSDYSASRHSNNTNSRNNSTSSSGRHQHQQHNRPEPAPRIVPAPVSTHRPPFLLSLLFAPFHMGFRAVSTLLRTVLYVFHFLPAPLRPRSLTTTITTGWKGTMGRHMLLPRDTASRFRREFEEEYYQPDTPANQRLPFAELGFAQALDLAKKEVKFLLVVLMSPEHDDTEAFTRSTLLSTEVLAFVNTPANNVVLWGGNVLDSEAYQVASEYKATKFPFSCLICLTPKEGSARMSTVKRLVGPVSPATYVAEIQTAMNRYELDLVAARAERTFHEAARNMRAEQDSAYERSLARDRERVRQRKEAERRAAEQAATAEKLVRNREQWRRWRSTTISSEPPTEQRDAVRLALKMPDGERVVRKFAPGATMQDLYAFVECRELLGKEQSIEDEKEACEPVGYTHAYKFRIASPMPRIVYEPDDGATLQERIGRGGNLIVEILDDEEDDAHDANDGGHHLDEEKV